LHEADGGVDDWVESFKVRVWEPPYLRARVRGVSNATLYVRPGRFTLEARRFYQRIGGWQEIEYEWPAVVVETLLPLGGPGLLFEMSGKLARCALPRQGARLRHVLHRAGFSVVEVRRWGWEAPRLVDPSVLGEHVGGVPRAVSSE